MADDTPVERKNSPAPFEVRKVFTIQLTEQEVREAQEAQEATEKFPDDVDARVADMRARVARMRAQADRVDDD